ncbi:hypothetical protein BS47DRAFT_1066649 [Hydnum rufescens UP504]|uniref:Uncharacterized protein n=1 Tax=Hydnum rufescens UP504 TaxID=1448309 RepID=A0A9P6AV96_9AGAM|nr:hypothetical protein BS47DRAFT_1066649 [Hydnum rufescens UP504]
MINETLHKYFAMKPNLTLKAESQLPISRRQIHISLHRTFSCLDVDYGHLDDSDNSTHGGYEAKEARRKRREKRLAKVRKAARGMQKTEADPEVSSDLRLSSVQACCTFDGPFRVIRAGDKLVLHKDAAKNGKWDEANESHLTTIHYPTPGI